MKINSMMILCKVVDNFGDIGVLYRLAKAVSDLRPQLELALVVSNLESFKSMAKDVNPSKDIQEFHYKDSVWKVVKWDLENCTPDKNFVIKADNLELNIADYPVIIEGFQCGRPDWLENSIFSEAFTNPVQILNLDYLTAEEYADDFHLLRSGTRKTNIKKRFFMPGFTEKTGGLIFSKGGGSLPLAPKQSFSATPSAGSNATRKARSFLGLDFNTRSFLGVEVNTCSVFNISFFSYERNCVPIVQAIQEFQDEMQRKDKNFSVCVNLASGKGHDPFMKAYEAAGKPFKVLELPFLQQEEWDYLLTQMNFNFIRGEDSLSRAALSGIPYVWHAYIQDEDYQLVKVNALLDRMEVFFDEEQFRVLKEYWNSYNKSTAENFALGIVAETPQRSEELQQEPGGAPLRCEATPKELLKKLLHYSALKESGFTESFRKFSEKLISNGNLAQHLLDFIDKLEM
ncbi:MAG: elongation factor P maturation arginine rhamnosyltransferase EarP [Treponema sp.]|nr:elongation factor P maturation arginine rhamnosyltransferase EarP [Candidatus Treponema equifaecale]